jgi:hypothetical protein
MPDITEYDVRAGTTNVDGLTFRKCRSLLNVTLPEGLLTIGDCAFSLCCSLRQIQIPASVERIGVAAFCKSGLVTIQFQGIPKVIEADVFEGCWQLKEIVVPCGSKDVFIREFGLPEGKVVEGRVNLQVNKQIMENSPEPPKIHHFVQKTIPLLRFSYNARYFYWAVGDEVNLRNVFSGPIILAGSFTYEFRRKALFVFVKSATARTLKQETVYELPVDIFNFAHKYQEKYASRSPRIFIFVCDDGKIARVFDEVKLVRINTNTIMVKSLLKEKQ